MVLSLRCRCLRSIAILLSDLLVALELVNYLAKCFRKIADFITHGFSCIKLKLVDLVLELCKVAVFLNEGENATQALAKLNQTDSVLVQDAVLFPLHDCLEDLDHRLTVGIHASALIHKENEVAIAEAERLSQSF